MRRIVHPGPPTADPVQSCRTRVTRAEVTLPAGRTLLAAASEAVAPHVGSAMLVLREAPFAQLSYYWPALSATEKHAVYYSQRFQAAVPALMQFGVITLGRRDGQAWMHCHALWKDAAGTPGCGHVLPDEGVLAEPMRATAWLLRDADFEVAPDAETNFSLFQPRSHGEVPAAGTPLPLAVRLGPNVDMCGAIESLCRQHGIRRAAIAGVGSTVGAVFDDGQVVEPFVTELFIRSGSVEADSNGAPLASIDVSMVDYTGAISEGRLKKGENPVLVTAELLLIPV